MKVLGIGVCFMQFVITFLEGMISFISPCMLPMLPVYISYFAGGADKKSHTMIRACAFVLGYTIVFTSLGIFAGSLGFFLTRYRTAVNIVSGIIIILFGLSYLELFSLPFFKGVQREHQVTGILSALIFGMVYSVNLTPCVGAFLGSAIMMASSSANAFLGGLLLLTYSLGLGIPFLLAAALTKQLNVLFQKIKKNYLWINRICGCFLILVGILTAFGALNFMRQIWT